jgi:hypothetical protein
MFTAPVVEERDIHFDFSNKKEMCTHLLFFEPDRMIITNDNSLFSRRTLKIKKAHNNFLSN